MPPELAVIWEVWELLIRDYVDPEKLDPHTLSEAAIRGMLSALEDPHTSYVRPQTFAIENEDYLGNFQGIGAEVSMRQDGKLIIVAPLPGSPAEAVGIRPGDIVLEVDGEPIEGLSLLEAVARIRGPEGSIVRLLIRHLTDIDPILVEVERGVISLTSVLLRSKPGEPIVHIRLTNYFPNTAELMVDLIQQAVTNGAQGLILDVRDNPGGLLTSVVDVAGQFLEADQLVVYEVDGDGRRKDWDVRRGGVAKDIPMVILVNEFSASASEVLVGALQDHNRATVIGATTFGKASVNIFRPLSNGGGLYVTYARWFTPKGRMIEEHGLQPDIEVVALERREADIKQLEKAIEVLEEMISAGVASSAIP